jgi:hypothetical protein
VRYGFGETALMCIESVHKGQTYRYYGEQFYGGTVGAYEPDIKPATQSEQRAFYKQQKQDGRHKLQHPHARAVGWYRVNNDGVIVGFVTNAEKETLKSHPRVAEFSVRAYVLLYTKSELEIAREQAAVVIANVKEE